MVVTPVPISLPLPRRGMIPIDISVVPLLPIHMPSAVFMLVKIVVVLVMLVVDVMTIVMVIVMVLRP